MIHKILCYDNDNQPYIINYDNIENTLKINNKDIWLPNHFKDFPLKNNNTIFSTIQPLSKSKNIDRLNIQLGLSCNYNCSYCKQIKSIDNSFEGTIEDARTFFPKVSQYLSPTLKYIYFWGGEPFLYWEQIKIITIDIKKVYKNAQICIITNGLLLDKEKINWIKENDIAITISHDGPAQDIRGIDPLITNKTLLLELVDSHYKKIGFNVVLTPKNNNILEIIDWFHNNLSDNAIVSFEGVVTIENSNKSDSVSFTDEQYSSMRESIYQAIITHRFNRIPKLLMLLMEFYRSLYEKRTAEYLSTKCSSSSINTLAVDLKGNVLTCHNVPANGIHKIGTLDNYDSILLNTSLHWSFREKCKDCPVLHICKGSCMYLQGEDFKRTCTNEYHFSLPILFGAIWCATGLIVSGFETEFKIGD